MFFFNEEVLIYRHCLCMYTLITCLYSRATLRSLSEDMFSDSVNALLVAGCWLMAVVYSNAIFPQVMSIYDYDL